MLKSSHKVLSGSSITATTTALIIFLTFNYLLWLAFFSFSSGKYDSANLQSQQIDSCETFPTEGVCRSNAHRCEALIGRQCGYTTKELYLGCVNKYNRSSISSVTGRCYHQSPNHGMVWIDPKYSWDGVLKGWQEDLSCADCFIYRQKLTLVIGPITSERLSKLLSQFTESGIIELFSQKLVHVSDTILPSLTLQMRELNVDMLSNEHFQFSAIEVIRKAVSASRNDILLYMEGHYRMTENVTFSQVNEELELAVRTLSSKYTIDVVSLRSRNYPGFLPEMFEFRGQEDKIFLQGAEGICNYVHWIPNAEVRWPDKLSWCGEEKRFLCSPSKHCVWKNRPLLFKKKWWKTLRKRIEPDQYYDEVVPSLWRDLPFVHAQIDGGFLTLEP